MLAAGVLATFEKDLQQRLPMDGACLDELRQSYNTLLLSEEDAAEIMVATSGEPGFADKRAVLESL